MEFQSTETEDRSAAPKRRVVKDPAGYYWSTGRRKSATARVRVRPGTGSFLVNGRELAHYFPDTQWVNAAIKPLVALDRLKDFDIIANVHGGGMTGQSEAISLGISRSLVSLEPESEPTLRGQSLLTRDSRMKERKKYGMRGARRAFQFSKR